MKKKSLEWLPKKESELASAFIPWIESSGWDVYQEVQMYRQDNVADLVLRRGVVIWVIEMKTSLSLDLMGQAEAWKYYSNYTSVIVPNRKSFRIGRASNYAKHVLERDGIGLITIGKGFDGSFVIEERIRPEFRRHNVAKRWEFLHEGYKVSGEAGNSDGERWTAFRQTCWNLWSFLDKNPGATLDNILKEVNHHYHTTSTAKQCILKWISRKIIRGVRVDENHRPYRFYLEEGFNWRAEAKNVA